MQIGLSALIFSIITVCTAWCLILLSREARRQKRRIRDLRKLLHSLAGSVAELRAEAPAEAPADAQRRRALDEERRFTEGISNILSYDYERKGQSE